MTSRGTVRAIFNYTRDTGIEPEIYFTIRRTAPRVADPAMIRAK